MKIRKKVATKAIFPIIFWPKCCLCNERFGFEIGYKHPGGSPYTTHFYYLCSNCGGHDIESADETFTNIKIRKSATLLPWPPGGTAVYRRKNKSNNDNYIKIIKETK